MEPKQQPPYPLRMPRDVRLALEEAADKEGRSLNAEIVGRLQSSLLETGSERQLLGKISELEGKLTRQRLETIKEKNKVNGYVLALMVIAKRVPSEAFEDQPHVVAMLNDLRENEDRTVMKVLESMLEDGKSVLADFHAEIDSGRVEVVSEEEMKTIKPRK